MSDTAILNAYNGSTAAYGLPDQVSPPAPAPADHTLVESALDVTEATVSRQGITGLEPWGAGFMFEPESCGQGVVWSACDPLNPVKTIGATPTGRGHIPMVIVGGWKCNATAWQVKDFKGHATRNLNAITSPQLEAELWTGAQAAKTAMAARLNMSLTTPDPVNPGTGVTILNGTLANPTPTSPRAALSLLQQGLANCGVAGRGMVHATPYLAELWKGGYMADPMIFPDAQYRRMLGADVQAEIARAGGLQAPGGGAQPQDEHHVLMATRGTIIVAGAGYPGTGPAGAGHQTPETNRQWAFGTGIVDIRLGGVRTYPDADTMARDVGDGMTRNTNLVEYRAERYGAAVFDPCCVVAVYVDLTLGIS
jgi:hypothetical protein